MKKILVLGATSLIAQEVSRLEAETGSAFFLVARSLEKMEAVKQDLLARGASHVHTEILDFMDLKEHPRVLEKAFHELQTIDVALLAHGTLPPQEECERDPVSVAREIANNFMSHASLLTILANYFEKQNSGTLAVISSVAGDRGRRSNYVYGSAKAGLSTFAQGLRARLSGTKVRVVTIKPGPVRTPMTAHMKQGPLFAKPTKVARDIHRSFYGGREVIYTPWFWRPVMLVLGLIPERFFKKLNF